MAQLAVLANREPVTCLVGFVVAAKAPRRRRVSELIGVRTPADLHGREDVVSVKRLRDGDRIPQVVEVEEHGRLVDHWMINGKVRTDWVCNCPAAMEGGVARGYYPRRWEEVPKIVYDPAERLSRIAEIHLERLGDDRDMAVVFQVELRGSTKFMEEFSAAGFAEYLDMIRETISAGQQSGAFRDDVKPVIAAKIFFGALDEMVTNWVLSKKSYPLAPLASEVLKVFFGGMNSR